MSTVLAAVDDSLCAGPVLAAAKAFAALVSGDVLALHVGADAGTTARAQAVRAGVPFRQSAGDPLEVLAATAASGISAVVVGARDRASSRAEAGHLPLALVECVPCPVMVVPPHWPAKQRFDRVLIALEGRPGRARPVRRAVDVVAGADLDLTVVHVQDAADVPAFSDAPAHEMRAFAQEYLARSWPTAPPLRLALPVGSPADEVLALAQELHPDVLVAGWAQGTGPAHGHVVRELLRRASCPVLLVAVEPAATPAPA